MKKTVSVIFIFMAFILGISCFTKIKHGMAFADEKIQIKCESSSAYLIEPNTGTVIYQKNECERLPIASMCKIMTLLLTFEEIDKGNLSLNDEIVVSDNAAGMGGSQVFLESNASYSVNELIKGIVVASANDASVAIAEKICGSEENFVDAMNEKTKELKMDNTVFANCTGLPKPGQYSCAKDVATMFCELIKHEDYFKFSSIWMDEIQHPKDRKTQISNTNKLIRHYEGCDGGKTGYTSEAGHCLVSTARRNDMRLVSVIIHAPNSKTRFKEASTMFNYGFANFTNKLVVDGSEPLDLKIKVLGGKKSDICVMPSNSVYIFSKKNEKVGIEIEYDINDKIKAPISKGDVVGKLIVYNDGKEISNVPVIAGESVQKESYYDSVKKTIDNWSIT